jgi:hypothetical protein
MRINYGNSEAIEFVKEIEHSANMFTVIRDQIAVI